MADISFKQFDIYNKNNFIADARKGGLVIGRSHTEGNIYMMIEKEDGYYFNSHMEGGEYIINHESSLKYFDRLTFINSHKDFNNLIHIDIIRKTPIILTQSDDDSDKFLLIDYRGQYIINKAATCMFLEELNFINSNP